MKKLFCLLAVTAMLTGCGVDESTVSRSEVSGSSETTEAVTDAPTDAPTEAPTEAPAQETEPETVPVTDAVSEPATQEETAALGEDFPAFMTIYSDLVSQTFRSYSDEETVSVSFALTELTGDDFPELLLKKGTCEADYSISVYTIDNCAPVLIGDQLPGGHTSFGLNTDTGALALLYGHMGYGGASQYKYENGQLVSAGDDFETEYIDSDDYFRIISEKGYKFIRFEEIFRIGDEVTSWLYNIGPSGNFTDEPTEFHGEDYGIIMTFPFA